ncbi:MAG: GNAT family N-acetyltransferase [Thermoguttaceae bacterium]|jgi:plasmid stabilization system protein ParE
MIATRTPRDAAAWNSVLAGCLAPYRDVYFLPEYHHLHEANGDGEALGTVVQNGDGTLLVPGIRMSIPPAPGTGCDHPLWDLQTCNGYGGPLASPSAAPDFLEWAWNEWRTECRRLGIVAGFFRLHPLLGNERFLPRDAVVVRDRQTVFLDFSRGWDILWKNAKSQYRNMVNKGLREGIEVCWNEPEAWEGLEEIYGRSMQRVDASQALRFSREYFAALRQLSGAELAGVQRQGRLVAVSVFLSGPLWCHYHLAARDPEAGNHLHSAILQSAIQRGCARGLRGMHLGGGRTAAPDDGLLRFKTSTGGDFRDFKVALVVADREKYDGLCNAWRQRAGCRPSWLLGYRQPIPARSVA